MVAKNRLFFLLLRLQIADPILHEILDNQNMGFPSH